MDKFIITKENGQCIPCIAEIPQNCDKIVIIIHGLLSSKESSNAAYMMKYFTQKGLGAIAYDQPGHGTEEAAKEPLLLRNCIASLTAVEKYVAENYHDAEICYFGSSFGAYVLGLYLSRKMNSGNKAFMRCAAVNFPQIIFEGIHKGQEHEASKKATIDGRETSFLKEFLEELEANSMIEIYNESLPENVRISFVHGEIDQVVPVNATKAFADKHGYPIVIVPDEGHTISNSSESPAIVAQTAYELFLY